MNERHTTDDANEAWADQVLRQLPLRQAPATLVLRILREIEARPTLPWHRRPWGSWPLGLRVSTAGMAVALLGSMAWAWFWLDWTPGAATSQVVTGFLGSVTAAVAHLLGALWTVLSHVGGSILLGVATFLTAAWIATLGLGTTCWRLATGYR